MPALLELQRAFGVAMLSGEAEAAASMVVAKGISPLARLSVYRNNVTANLTGALKLTFPVIERLVGADFFAAMATRFLAVAPPGKANLYHWGDAFPTFLQEYRPAASLPYLPDVARLEWAIGRALHAPDIPALDLRMLSRLAADDRASIRFRRHPAVSLLALRHPAHRIWQAVLARDDAALRAIDPESSEWLMVHRAGPGADVLPVTPAGLAFARALCQGTPLQSALSAIDADTASGLLGAFLARGVFSGVLGTFAGSAGCAAADSQKRKYR